MPKRPRSTEPENMMSLTENLSSVTENLMSLRKRVLPVTAESIDDILGLAAVDRNRPSTLYHVRKNILSHHHPFGSSDIHQLGFDALCTILSNYDRNNDSATLVIQPDRDISELDYLVTELAYAVIIKIKEMPVNIYKLERLLDNISTSKYLASHKGMQELVEIGRETLLPAPPMPENYVPKRMPR